jgi:hypothetical protein
VPGFFVFFVIFISWRKRGGAVQFRFKRDVQLSSCTLVIWSVNNSKGEAMKKIVLAIATAATLAVTAVAAPAPAEARGGRVAAGVIGGLAAGALIAGAASGAYAYGPRYGYYGGPAYVAGPPCGWERQRFWDGYGWRIRRVRVCY